MKHLIASLIFPIMLLSAAFCQQSYATDLIPSYLRERALATVRHDETIVHMRAHNHVTLSRKRAVTIHHRNADEHAAIVMYYNKSRDIQSVKGEIYNEFGIQIGKFSLKDFRDHSASGQNNLYDDVRVKHYQPSVTQYPYTIVYTAEIRENQNLWIPVWRPDYDFDVSVEKSTYTFQCGPDEHIRIDERNYAGKPIIETTDKLKSYVWHIENVIASRSEPYSPPRHLNCVQVRLVPQRFQYYRRTGQFSDWNECGKWIYDVLLSNKRSLPAATVAKVKSMTEQASTPKEKAHILYEYLQAKTRYISIQVGIGGLEPFPAESVDRLGYGDCKALVNYMQSMLDVVDIPSYYCVVEAGRLKEDISRDFANVSDGNHIILCIPFENDTTWLECTSQKSPFGFLGDFTDDRLVLACTPGGGKLLRTPKYSEKENLQYREAYFQILDDGSLKGSVKTTFAGTQLDNHFHNSYQPNSEQLKNLAKWYNVDNISFDKISYKILTDSLKVEETFDAFIKNYAVASSKFLILHPNIFNSTSTVPQVRNRLNDVYINRGYTDVDIITYTLPRHIDPNIQPVIKKLEVPMGTYELRTHIKDGKLTSYRRIQLREGRYPVAQYEDFHHFMQDANAADRGKYNLPLKN